VRRLKRLAVIGVGLVGGSLALALRRAGAVGSIAGYDRDAQAVERAAALGVIDTAAASASDAAKGADLVVVAVPVRSIGSVLHDVALAMDRDAVVTDVGSTKGEVVAVARDELRDRFPRFVPGHPIAGREASGVEAAVADLFRTARVVLTPDSATAPDAVELVKGCWEAAGARVASMPAERHDRIFAAVSHLPHMLSFALVSEIAAREDAEELLGFAAGGFRDFTRIAASDPTMWRDVFLNNKDAVLEVLGRFSEDLSALQRAIRWGDGDALFNLFTRTRAIRRGIIDAGQDSATPNFGRNPEHKNQ
jgi:prephenate dehydrogenase